MKFSKKMLWLILMIAFGHLVLADTGVCYREARWASKLELVDRALFNDKFSGQPITLSQEEKGAFVKDQYASPYPELCQVKGSTSELSGWENIANLILGRKLYEVECLSINSPDVA